MCRMYRGVGRKRLKLYKDDFYRKSVYFRDNAAVMMECPRLCVTPYIVSGWLDGELPSYTSWMVIAKDLMAMPAEALWCLRYLGRTVLMVTRWRLPDYPLYSNFPGSPNGLGWPQPAFKTELSYAEWEEGIGFAGYGVPVHEVGHLVDFLYNGNLGRDHDKFPPFSSSSWWRSVHRSIKWPDKMTQEDPGEAFADSFAIFCLSRQADGWRRLPQDLDQGIIEFWKEFGKAANWPSVTRREVVSEIERVPNLSGRAVKNEILRGMTKVGSLARGT